MEHCCLILLMVIISLSSCSTSDISEPESEPVSLTVNISKQTPTTVTRAISDAIDDIKIMVFNAQGNLIGSAYTTASPTSVSVPVRTSAGCTICAIANTGSSSYLDGISTITELRTKVTTPVTSATTLAGKSNEILYGETLGVNITTSTASQSVSLKRLYSKYTFTITPSSDIVITSYQLCNVPNECFIGPGNTSNPTANYSGLSYSSVLASKSAGGTVTSPSYYVYENLAGKVPSLTAMEQRTSANAPSGASYLLINAQNICFNSGWKSTYKIYLGGVTSVTNPVVDCTDFNIYRNYDYKCNISISGSGMNDVRVSYSVNTSNRPNTYIGDATIGDYLYSDGTWGETFKSGTTVGIIYSNEISKAQYDAGCRHGRVLALKDACGACAWSNVNTSSPYADQTIHPYCKIYSTFYNDVSSGYDALSANSSYVGDSNNPAWYYCTNYSDGTTKSFTNSGWYLPSTGDWWDVMENLCTWTPDQYTTIKSMRTSSNVIGVLISDLSSSCYSNLDSKLAAGGAGAALNHVYFYCCASEYNSNNVCLFYFYSSFVNMNYGNKSYPRIYVRAVLAF